MEKKLKSNLIYDGKIIKLYNDDVVCDGDKKSTREYVVHPGGACILPIINDEIIFIKQYRYAYQKDILELPAGKLEKGEDPKDAAKRELEEETGYIAGELIPLGSVYPSVGYTDEVIHLFLGRNLTRGKQHFDYDENIDVVRIKIDDALDMISRDEIKDAKTVIAILKYKEFVLNNDPSIYEDASRVNKTPSSEFEKEPPWK